MSTALRTRLLPYFPRYLVTSPVPIENPTSATFFRSSFFNSFVEVGGKRVVVVADGGFTRPAEPPAIACDDAMPGGEERGRLLLPRRPTQRPPVNQNNR